MNKIIVLLLCIFIVNVFSDENIEILASNDEFDGNSYICKYEPVWEGMTLTEEDNDDDDDLYSDMCNDNILKYTYDSKTKSCIQYIYHGCFATPNLFDTIDECNKICGNYQERALNNDNADGNDDDDVLGGADMNEMLTKARAFLAPNNMQHFIMNAVMSNILNNKK